jgi:hypothetical protein
VRGRAGQGRGGGGGADAGQQMHVVDTPKPGHSCCDVQPRVLSEARGGGQRRHGASAARLEAQQADMATWHPCEVT